VRLVISVMGYLWVDYTGKLCLNLATRRFSTNFTNSTN